MRYVLIFLLGVLWLDGYAQGNGLQFHSYAERYYFVTNLLRSLDEKKTPQILDTLRVIEKKAEDAGDPELIGELKLHAYIASSRGEVRGDTIEHDLKDLLAYATDNNLRYLEADVLKTLGDYYYYKKRKLQREAVEHYIAAYDVYKNFSSEEFPPKQSYTYILGGAFYSFEDYENAIKYLHEAWSTKQSVTDDIYCSLANTIGLCYRNMRSYDSAIYYFIQTYQRASSQGNRAYQGIAEGNIGITYFLQGKYDDAIPLLRKDITSSIATRQIKNAAWSMGILATIYNDQHHYDSSERLLNYALQITEDKPFWPNYPIAEQLYTQLSRVYVNKKDFYHAYLYADSALVAKDSAASQKNVLALAKAHDKLEYTQRKLETEKYQNQIKIAELEIGETRIQIIFAVLGVVTLLIVILFISRERKRSENLLLNILPEKIAERLKKKEHPIADYFDHASILFVDMAGFTKFSDGKDPKEIVTLLNNVFTRFDALADKHGLEKIKTIGDCYMAVSGLPEINLQHAEAAARMALDLQAEMKGYRSKDGTPIFFRIGLDCGPVVAGVIGRRKFIYDLWGDTVNTASRM